MSTLNVANITDGTDTVETGYVVNGSAKAWANSPSDGEAVNQSFNISSLTDVGTGVQRFNLTNSFSTANYSAVFVPRGNINQCWVGSMVASYWETANYTGSTYEDAGIVTTAHGDLA